MDELIGHNDNIIEVDGYKPTIAEEKILEVCLNPDNTGKNSTEKMSIAGVCRETWYKAFRKSGFIALLNKTSVDLVKEKVSDVLTASIKSATTEGAKGFQDRKMLLEMAGLYREKQDINLNAEDPAKLAVMQMTDGQIMEKIAELARNNPELVAKMKEKEA